MLPALPVSLQIGHRLRLLVRLWMRARRALRLGAQRRDERVALVHEPFPGPAAVPRADDVFAEERKRDRRVAIRDDRVGKHPWIDLPPADGLRRRGARKTAPHHLAGRQLDEEVVASLRDAVDLPTRKRPLYRVVLELAATKDAAPLLFCGAGGSAT